MSYTNRRRDVLRGIGLLGAGAALYSGRGTAAPAYSLYSGAGSIVRKLDVADPVCDALLCKDKDGSVEWAATAEGTVRDLALTDTGGTLASIDSSGWLILWDTWDGSEVARYQPSGAVSGLAISYGEGHFYCSFGDGSLVKLSSSDGSVAWSMSFSESITSLDYAARGDNVYINAGSFFASIDASTNSENWRNTSGYGLGNGIEAQEDDDLVMVIDTEEIYLNKGGGSYTYQSRVRSLDAVDGSQVWMTELVQNSNAIAYSLALDSGDDDVYVGLGNGDLYQLEEDTGEISSNFPTTQDGAVLSLTKDYNTAMYAGMDSSVANSLIEFDSDSGTTTYTSDGHSADINALVMGVPAPEPATATATPTATATEPATATATPTLSTGSATLFMGLFGLLGVVGAQYKNRLALVVLGLSMLALAVRFVFHSGGNVFVFGIVLTTILTVLGLVVRINGRN